MTPADHQEAARLRQNESLEFDTCRQYIGQRNLQMELVNVEHLFGGERIVFYFLAEKRVDFRELVKDLAREYRTRIEMRQIGVRDEAKLLADYGDCGKPVCCNTHMSVMPPVSMRMAKLQKSTLDPSKISGRCGRLKCCLRFEQDVYEEFQQQLPPPGARILTQKGQGRVLAQEILARKVLVEFEDGRRVVVLADEILTRLG
jgi:cell fate regulator YaaT (PSP1 superfamily)